MEFQRFDGGRYELRLERDDELIDSLTRFAEDEHITFATFSGLGAASSARVAYFDAEARFINAHYNVPVCRGDPCPTYASDAPARYVLELNAGVGKALGLARGDVLTLP